MILEYNTRLFKTQQRKKATYGHLNARYELQSKGMSIIIFYNTRLYKVQPRKMMCPYDTLYACLRIHSRSRVMFVYGNIQPRGCPHTA